MPWQPGQVPGSRPGPSARVSDDPVEFYRALFRSQDEPKNLWFHQGEVVHAHAPSKLRASDVALQLPPGAGKTIVGGTIAKRPRRKFEERVHYVCASKLVVKQTATNLTGCGTDCVKLIGSNYKSPEEDRLRYSSAQGSRSPTYWSIFNSHPPLADAQLLILDDALQRAGRRFALAARGSGTA